MSFTHQILGKMIVNISSIAVLSFIVSLVGLSAAISGDAVKAASANLTAYNTPYAFYDYERDPRRWFGNGQYAPGASFGGPLAQFPGGMDAIAIGLMMAVGAGFIVIPLMIILYMIFVSPTGNPTLNGGFNFVQHPATTTIGRKRRDAGDSPQAEAIASGLPDIVSPVVQEKLLSFFRKIANAPDRMEYLKNILKP